LSRYDRYVLSQLLLVFGFFALILVGVFWINRAVKLFDRLIGDGHSALVFFEFTALSLPNLIRMVLPMAAFAAAVYVTNRLKSESELTVMQATGSGPWRLARPVVAFGLVAAAMMSVLTHYLLPAATKQLEIRQAEISRNVTARLLTEGSFLHPTKGITFFIGEIAEDGTLSDVFMSDRRSEGRNTIYTANRAFLIRNGERSNLIMVDGLAQSLDAQDRVLSTTVFEDLSYDISEVIKPDLSSKGDVQAIPTAALIAELQNPQSESGVSRGQTTEELHLRFARALFCISVAMIGYSALMVGGFSRFGVWRQILFAFVALIALEGLRNVVSEPVASNPALWLLVYVPALLGLAVSALLLLLAAYPAAFQRFGRQKGTEVAS